MKRKYKDGTEWQEGDHVMFNVENQYSGGWIGDLEGVLIKENNEFVIKTKNSGIITIDKYLDAYSGSIRRLKRETQI